MMSKPFAYLQYSDVPARYGVDCILGCLRHEGLDRRDFVIRQYDYLPERLEDSFSARFLVGAERLGMDIVVTVADYV